jgi:CheY-like chemotaxis protein
VTLRISFIPASNGAPPASAQLRFDIIDTGMGMPADELNRLFQSFTQGDASTTRRFGGTGLGLVISKRLANMLGGDVLVQSDPGRGSTFTVLLNVEVLTSAPVPHPAAEKPEAPGSHALRSLRIMLVEDGLDNQRLISHHLKKAGAEVEVAANGRIAVDRLTELDAAGFDAILMDMQMPEMDGYEATRHLRAAKVATPIIALTAHAMSGDREKCLKAGCNDYLTKPVDKTRMIQTILQLLNRVRDTEPAAPEAANA